MARQVSSTSAVSVGSGMASSVPSSTNRLVMPDAAALSRMNSRSRVTGSTAKTCRARLTAPNATLPLPAPASITVLPARSTRSVDDREVPVVRRQRIEQLGRRVVDEQVADLPQEILLGLHDVGAF